MTRRSKRILGAVLALPLIAVLAVAALFVALPRLELAPYAAARLTAQLGRAVTIEGLTISPGLATTVTLRGLAVANIEGGSAPQMARLDSATAVLDLLPLLRRQVVLRQVRAEGFDLLLERDARKRRNWRFHGDAAGPSTPFSPEPPDRSGLPVILDVGLSRANIVFRTSSGTPLRTELTAVTLVAPARDQPLTLRAQGAYQSIPVSIAGTLGTPDQLRDGTAPFPYPLRATAPETVLAFDGTSRDPLNFDRLEGRLSLQAGSLGAILTMAGAGPGPAFLVGLAGAFRREGDRWRLTAARGEIDNDAFTAPRLELVEGPAGEPDAVAAEIDFTRLDLNALFGAPPAQPGDGRGQADIPLTFAAAPDPRLNIRATAREFAYADLAATEVRLVATAAPGRIAAETLTMRAYGARLEATGALEPSPRGGKVTANVALREGNLDTLRQAFGIRSLPAQGPMEARVAVAAEGATMNAATRQAHISAVVSMRSGSIAREVIEMASTDLRALFRTARGQTPLTCLLAVVDIRDGRGEAAPLRIRAGTGTISGLATFDLNRRVLDLVIGSQSETTDFFALDIPVRVSGSFADPNIAPASWSGEGRARLAAGDRIAPLPPALRDFARQNPCFRAGAGR
ncbi:AsmA family protein [Roseomonas terrae]|uniref:AsmA family protein n=1 Tax=Neoroseomonas terrae TaxID=424799 RepID=A0ABS5EDT8_9PROT|nr:AsmA family protein [Neoroseomonas terrae]MBR0649188.1 AsmA family protein [Neoroseomonas terrae]